MSFTVEARTCREEPHAPKAPHVTDLAAPPDPSTHLTNATGALDPRPIAVYPPTHARNGPRRTSPCGRMGA